MGMVTAIALKSVSVILGMLVRIAKFVIQITGLLITNAWSVQRVRMAESVMPLHSVNVQKTTAGTRVHLVLSKCMCNENAEYQLLSNMSNDFSLCGLSSIQMPCIILTDVFMFYSTHVSIFKFIHYSGATLDQFVCLCRTSHLHSQVTLQMKVV